MFSKELSAFMMQIVYENVRPAALSRWIVDCLAAFTMFTVNFHRLADQWEKRRVITNQSERRGKMFRIKSFKFRMRLP
jgi:hypothetical protein